MTDQGNEPVNGLDFSSEEAFLTSLGGESPSEPMSETPGEVTPQSQPPADAPAAAVVPGQQPVNAPAPAPQPQQPDPNTLDYWRARAEEADRTRSAAQAKMFETLNEMKQLRAQFEQRLAQPSTPQAPAQPQDPVAKQRERFVKTFQSEFQRLTSLYPDTDPEEIRAQASLNAYKIDMEATVEERLKEALATHPMVQKTNEWAREQRTARMRETIQQRYPHLNDHSNPVSVKTWEKFYELLKDAGEATGTKLVNTTDDGRVVLTDAYFSQVDGPKFLSEAHKLALGELREEEFKSLLTNAYTSGQRDAHADANRAKVVATVPVGTAPTPKPVIRENDLDYFAKIAAS